MATVGNIEVPEKELAELCRRYYVRELALFGSVLRDDFRPDSDVDVLVEFEPGAPIGLIEHLSLQEELSGLLGRRVDLVSKRGLHLRLKRSVLASSQVLYAA